MEELLQEFRMWELSWSWYKFSHKDKPISAEEFIKKLEKKYKVIKNE